jgi:hypothetical protein
MHWGVASLLLSLGLLSLPAGPAPAQSGRVRRGCSGTLRLKATGAPAVSEHFDLGRGRRGVVRSRATRALARRLARAAQLRVRITTRSRDRALRLQVRRRTATLAP